MFVIFLTSSLHSYGTVTDIIKKIGIGTVVAATSLSYASALAVNTSGWLNMGVNLNPDSKPLYVSLNNDGHSLGVALNIPSPTLSQVIVGVAAVAGIATAVVYGGYRTIKFGCDKFNHKYLPLRNEETCSTGNA